MFNFQDVYEFDEIEFKVDGKEHLLKDVKFFRQSDQFRLRWWKSECGRFSFSSNRVFDPNQDASSDNRPFLANGRSCKDQYSAAVAVCRAAYEAYYEACAVKDRFEQMSKK